MSTDQDFASEQDYIRSAYGHLDAMRRRAESLVGHSEDPDLEAALMSLKDAGGNVILFAQMGGG